MSAFSNKFGEAASAHLDAAKAAKEQKAAKAAEQKLLVRPLLRQGCREGKACRRVCQNAPVEEPVAPAAPEAPAGSQLLLRLRLSSSSAFGIQHSDKGGFGAPFFREVTS